MQERGGWIGGKGKGVGRREGRGPIFKARGGEG